MTTTTSDGTPQFINLIGTTLPVIIDLSAQQGTIRPGVFVSVTDDADLYGVVELSCDRAGSTGLLPIPGLWFPFREFLNCGGFVSGPINPKPGVTGGYAKLDMVVTAVRFRLTAWNAGSATFAVTQNRLVPLPRPI